MASRAKLTAALALLIAGALLAPAPAFAHASYASSTPGAGEVLAAIPARVEITFTQRIQKVDGAYSIDVMRDRGVAVTTGPAVVDETDHMKLSVPLQPSLQPSRYVVTWKNVSDEDGHTLQGAFAFYVNTLPNAVDLQNDKQLGTESITPSADQPVATVPLGSTAAISTAADTARSPSAAATGARSPGISAATPLPTSASFNGDSRSDRDRARYIIVGTVGAIVASAVIGFGAQRYISRRRR